MKFCLNRVQANKTINTQQQDKTHTLYFTGTADSADPGPMPAAASPDFLTINVTEAEASNYVIGLEYEVTIRLVEQA